MCLVTLVACEVILHYFHPVHFREIAPRKRNDLWRELIHQPSSVHGLVYELVPNCKRMARGKKVTINSYGMRGDEPVSSGKTPVRRIIVVGDSFTFGFGVGDEETYSKLLEDRLNEIPTEPRTEVLNLGVSGYSTRDEALVIHYKGLSWDPDLVIIGYVLNDPEAEALQPLHRYFERPRWWQHLNIGRLIASTKFHLEVTLYGEGDYIRYLHSPGHHKWGSVISAFKDIRTDTVEQGTLVILLIFPLTKGVDSWSQYPYLDLQQQVASTAELNGFQVIDLYDSFSGHPLEEVMLSDGHPNERGHSLTAEAIYKYLSAQRWSDN